MKFYKFNTLLESLSKIQNIQEVLNDESPKFTLTKGDMTSCFCYMIQVILEGTNEEGIGKVYLEEGIVGFLMEVIEQLANMGDQIKLEIAISICTILKAITGVEDVRKRLLEPKNVERLWLLLEILIPKTAQKK